MAEHVICELCPCWRTGGAEAATAAGWMLTWDGWLCPQHAQECSEDDDG